MSAIVAAVERPYRRRKRPDQRVEQASADCTNAIDPAVIDEGRGEIHATARASGEPCRLIAITVVFDRPPTIALPPRRTAP
jgi:hypothetical protein